MSLFGYNQCAINPFGKHLYKYIGQTVTVYTVGGDHFTGTLLFINYDFITLNLLYPAHEVHHGTVSDQSAGFNFGDNTYDDNTEIVDDHREDGYHFNNFTVKNSGRTSKNAKKIRGRDRYKDKVRGHLSIYTECYIPLNKITAFFHYQ
jgi:hypothetical protein